MKTKSLSEVKRLKECRVENVREPKYWICGACAEAKLWRAPTWPVTVIRGLCSYCERPDETFLTPCCDFSGPNGKKAVWD